MQAEQNTFWKENNYDRSVFPTFQLPVAVYESVIDLINGEVSDFIKPSVLKGTTYVVIYMSGL